MLKLLDIFLGNNFPICNVRIFILVSLDISSNDNFPKYKTSRYFASASNCLHSGYFLGVFYPGMLFPKFTKIGPAVHPVCFKQKQLDKRIGSEYIHFIIC